MTGFNHGMTGAVIALTVKQPAVALPLSFLSHFVQDAIPHFGFAEKELFGKKFNTLLICDFLFAVITMAILGVMFPQHKWLVWGCMTAAASPDLMWAYHRLYVEHIKHKKMNYGPIARVHDALQRSETIKGAYIEAAWFAVMGALILLLRK